MQQHHCTSSVTIKSILYRCRFGQRWKSDYCESQYLPRIPALDSIQIVPYSPVPVEEFARCSADTASQPCILGAIKPANWSDPPRFQ